MIKLYPIINQPEEKNLEHWRWLWHRQIAAYPELHRRLESLILTHFEIQQPACFDDLYTKLTGSEILIMRSITFFNMNVTRQKYIVRNFQIILVDYVDSQCLHLTSNYCQHRIFLNARDVVFTGSNVENFTESLQHCTQVFSNMWPSVVISHDPFLQQVVSGDTASRQHAENLIRSTTNSGIQIPCRAPRPVRLELLQTLWQMGMLDCEQIDWSLVFLPEPDDTDYAEYSKFLHSGLVPRSLSVDGGNTHAVYDHAQYCSQFKSYKIAVKLGEDSLCSAGLGKYGWYIAAETFSDEHYAGTWGRMSHITEKSYKGFLQGSNTIILGAPGHQAKLREQGFWLPDYGIDHLDGLERARAIAELVPELLSDTQDYTEQRIHNFRLATNPEWLVEQILGNLVELLSNQSG